MYILIATKNCVQAFVLIICLFNAFLWKRMFERGRPAEFNPPKGRHTKIR